ncbi:MAG: DUF58 domain-containing protein [Thermoguttaceae bacterium]
MTKRNYAFVFVSNKQNARPIPFQAVQVSQPTALSMNDKSTSSKKSLSYFDPEALKRITRLDLRARYIVDGFLSGIHRSRHFGSSIEFRQHRQYSPGDDPRHVDWKVWARQDRLYVKQYEVDTHLRLTLLLDTSASMLYASRAMSKYDYACTLGCSLAYLAMRQQDAVGCVTFDRDVTSVLPHKTRQSQLHAVTETMVRNRGEIDSLDADRFTDWAASLDTREQLSAANFGRALQTVAETVPQSGLIVILSDLLLDTAELDRSLRLLRSRRHDVTVFQILDDDEIDFPFTGATQFEGLDVPLRLKCDARSLRSGYLAALEEHLANVRRICSEHRADYVLFRTSTPFDVPLAAYLAHRAGA